MLMVYLLIFMFCLFLYIIFFLLYFFFKKDSFKMILVTLDSLLSIFEEIVYKVFIIEKYNLMFCFFLYFMPVFFFGVGSGHMLGCVIFGYMMKDVHNFFFSKKD